MYRRGFSCLCSALYIFRPSWNSVGTLFCISDLWRGWENARWVAGLGASGWRRPHHCRAVVAPGSTWIFSRALWISSSFYVKTVIPPPLPPASEARAWGELTDWLVHGTYGSGLTLAHGTFIRPPPRTYGSGRPAHGTGWLASCARTFRIPNGAAEGRRIAPESFSRDPSAKLGIAAPAPPRVGPSSAVQLFEMWNAVTDCRICRNRWTSGTNDAECQEISEVVSRNVAKARTRLGLEQARLQAGPDADIRDQQAIRR